jgi:hypothetical protein
VVDLGRLTLSGVVAWSFWGTVHLFVTVVSANRFKQSLLPTSPTDVDIDPGMDPVAVAAAWACMIGSDTPHQRARLIDRQPAEDDLTQRLQAAISSD